jgi:hypothetical protein
VREKEKPPRKKTPSERNLSTTEEIVARGPYRPPSTPLTLLG